MAAENARLNHDQAVPFPGPLTILYQVHDIAVLLQEAHQASRAQSPGKIPLFLGL